MFNLSFLNSGVLLAAISTIIPLLIYLFAKKKPKQITFSSLKFIKQSQQQQLKKINIRNILLLVIRMLIILLTILAIARPTLKASFLNQGTNHPKTAIAIIIDNSYSMDYLVDTQTDLEKAKTIAHSINELLTKNDITTLITLNNTWNKLHSNMHYGKLPQSLINSVEITPLPQSLKSALDLANRKLQESHIPNREIYVITDFQQQELPEKTDIPIFFIPTSNLSQKNNLSCQNTHLINEFIEKSTLRKIGFDIINHTNKPQQDVICRLFLDGRTIAEKVINLLPNQKKAENFSINLESSGWHSGYIEVNNERLAYDNRNYFSFSYNPSPQIAIITDSLNIPEPLSSILEIYSNRKYNILTSDNYNYDTLSQFDNIIIYKKHNFSERLNFLLQKLINNNRKILFIADKNLSIEAKSFISKSFNLHFNNFSALKKKIDFINQYHPVTKSLNSNNSVNITDYWDVSTQSNILLQTGNHPLALEKNNSCLWLFDIANLNSPFLLNSAFPVFAFNTLLYTNYNAQENKSVKVGQNIKLQSDKITLPNSKTINISKSNYTALTSGIYSTNIQTVAANLDYTESDFKTYSDKINNNNIIFLDQQWEKHILQARYGYEIWQHLLFIVIFLFIVEMFLVKKAEH